jgi:Tol biopolymer transport system component
MNHIDHLGRELSVWFEDTATPRVPDFTHDILRLTAGTRQRPRWSFPERWLPMSVITLGRQTFKPLPWRTIGLLAVLALLLAVAAVYVGSQPRLPEPFGLARNGVLVSEQDGDIVRIDPVSGSRSTIVTGPVPADDEPVFSRDGMRLAFIRETSGVRSLWVSDADGANQRELSTEGLVDFAGIAWSPDGRSIAVTSGVDLVQTISIVPTDGGAGRELDVGIPASGPQGRHPDGRELLFRGATPSGFGLLAVRPDGTGLRPITGSNGLNEHDALFFAWSPDGNHVAYQWSDRDGPQLIYVVSADGGTPRAITKVESLGPLWSPDGRWIAYVDGSDPSGTRVAVVASDGSGPVVQGPPDEGVDFVWAPDGTKLLFQGSSSSTAMLLDPAGGPTVPTSWSLTYPSNPDWQRLAP